MDKQIVIEAIVKAAQGADSLTQSEFEERSKIDVTTARDTFGTWNQAILAAGLQPIPPGGAKQPNRIKVSDEEYLQEIHRLSEELGKQVTHSEMNAKGRYSVKPYSNR